MSALNKSTIVRLRNAGLRAYYRYVGPLAPGRAARAARDLWFTAPPRMADFPVPERSRPFEVEAQGHAVRGLVWGDGAAGTVYLMHGWGGRGTQFGAMVAPLVEAGHRVVLFDAPAHGDSDHGPAGPGQTNGVEFAKALDAVFCRFGPAEAVVAHSMGTISTYLAMRYGWLGAERLVFIAPMVESESLFDQFQRALGFGSRTRRAFDRHLDAFVGIPMAEFDAIRQASYVDPVPTLVVHDRGDRQTPWGDAARLVDSLPDARLVSTEGLGHRRILKDPGVVREVMSFLREADAREGVA